MNINIQNEEVQKKQSLRTAATAIVDTLLLLSASEIFYTLFWYINFYQRVWWKHSVSMGGGILLVGLFTFAIFIGFLGYQSHTRPQKVMGMLRRLIGGLPLLCFLVLALSVLLMIILKPVFFEPAIIRVVNKHLALLYLAVLLVLQMLFTLFFLKITPDTTQSLHLFRNFKNIKKKLADENIFHIIMLLRKYAAQNEFISISVIFVVLILFFFVPTLVQKKLPLSTSYLYQFSPWLSYRGQFKNDMFFNNVLSDDYDSGIPAMKFLYTEIRDGNFPFWVPYVNSGIPYGILMFSSVFSLHGFAVLLGGVKWGTMLYMCLKIYIAGISIYFYLRYRRFARMPSFLGSLVLMFSTHLIVNGMSEVPDAVIYAPAILLFAERFTHERRYWQFFCLVISVTMALLSGFPSVIMYTLLLVVLYLTYRNLAEFQEQKIYLRIKNLMILYSAFGVGILLLTFTLLPTYEFFKGINIGYRIGRGPTIFEWVMIGRLINPNICGNPIQGNWFCSSNYNETALYVGLMPLMLIPFSITNKKYLSTSWFFFAVAVLILMIVFGVSPLNLIVGGFPLFNVNPNTRMIALLPFCFAFISATGIDNLMRTNNNKAYWSMIYFVLLIICAFWVFDNIPLAHITKELRAQYYFDQSFFTMLFLFGYFLIIMAILTFKRKGFISFVSFLLLFFNFMERSFFMNGYQGASYPGTFYPKTPAITFLESKMPRYERIVTIGRDFIPSFPLYYSINSLVGHAFADVAFKNNLELINPGIYVTDTTQPFFTSTSIDLLSPLLDAYRVRYIVTSPSEAPIWSVNVAEQREYNQSYVLGDIKSFGQSVTVKKSGYMDVLEIRISAPGMQIIPVNVKIFSQDGLLINFNSRLVRQDSDHYSINLPRILLRQDEMIAFEITPTEDYLSSKSNLLTVDFDAYKEGTLRINGNEIKGDMAFALFLYEPRIEQKYKLVHNEDLNIYENTTLADELMVVNKLRYSRPVSCAATLSQIDVFNEAVVEDQGLVLAKNNFESSARIREYGVNNIIIDADVKQTSMIILSDTYDMGWRATLDGKQTKIYRVNCAMRGVVVTSGKHEIKMNYVPPLFRIGLGISLFTLSCLVFAGVFITIGDLVKRKSEKRHKYTFKLGR